MDRQAIKFFPVTLTCRLRHAADNPLEFNTTHVKVTSPTQITTTNHHNGSDGVAFSLDRCFDIGISNQYVYDALEPTLIGTVLSGYSACYLCYGHTNTGKTHTVFGSTDDDPG